MTISFFQASKSLKVSGAVTTLPSKALCAPSALFDVAAAYAAAIFDKAPAAFFSWNYNPSNTYNYPSYPTNLGQEPVCYKTEQ